MKKKELEILEKINEERKIDKETRVKIQKRLLKNFLFAVGILIVNIAFMLIERRLDKQLAILIYKVSSIVLFVCTLGLFEIAYKKDDDRLAITGIEMFFLSIITLLAPYLLINKKNVYNSIIGVYFAIYFVIKNYCIYKNEKKNYLIEKNDISEIIKKESQDQMAQEQLEKIRKEQEKIEEKDEKLVNIETKRRGRPRKTETTVKTTKNTTKIEKNTKTNAKKTTKTEEKIQETETQPKRKRGRPKKVVKNEE